MQHNSTLYRLSAAKVGAFLGPGALLYGFVVLVPIVWAVRHSFFTDLNFRLTFAGFANYVRLVQDSDFWLSLRNNMTILVLSLSIQITLAFIIATMMNANVVRRSRFYRAVMFFPVVLSPVVVGFIWVLIYNIHWGLLNSFLRGIGLESWTRLWLDDPGIVIYSVTVPLMWQYLGLFMVIFLAGLAVVPKDLLEAAEIDGAGGVRKTIHVTLPLLARTWRVVLILAISGAVKVFEQPYVMTRGGPGMSSTVLAQYAYDLSFKRVQMTYSSTVAVGMLLISLTLILVTQVVLDKLLVRGRDADA